MSRASSTSEGEVAERPQKANTVNQPSESAIIDSDRVFGLDGASDNHGSTLYAHNAHWKPKLTLAGYNYRALSRSPSPYRRKRSPSRSPPPYRKGRPGDRSPSPYRHRRADQGHRGNDSRSHHKRKASPPRGNRPDKRPYTDRTRHSDPRFRSHRDNGRAPPPQSGLAPERNKGSDQPLGKPISYAELEKPNAVPDFRAVLPVDTSPAKSAINGSKGQRQQPSVSEDVEMYVELLPSSSLYAYNCLRKFPIDGPDYSLAPAEEKVPTQESREEKRRRWAAIRAAAEQQKPKESLLQQAILTNASEVTSPTIGSPAQYPDSLASPFESPQNADFDSVPASPDVMIIDKPRGSSEVNSPSAASPSAADYDPMQDMLDDRDRAAKKIQSTELPADAYQETDPKTLSTLPAEKATPVKKQKKDIDMFADSDEEDEAEEVEASVHMAAKGTVLDERLLDNWDDPEGYYKLISNELVNGGRYQVIKALGRGVFANVAQAAEVTTGNAQNRNLVAIKMIRRNELMRKASQKEMDFLRKVNEADPQDKRHIIRLLGSFDHKGHLCIVFEHMSKNLRDLLKEETNGHGLSLPAVRTYARQMFLGLQHLQNCQVIHLDLKPDNVLVSPDKKIIKLADFGTAVDKRDQIERTEYLVSRFYRAPEIILGMEIGYPVDMWAVGCTVYELWTGKILFTGRSNNQMIKSFMDCLGWPSEKLLKKGLVNNILENFEVGPPLKFISREVDQNNKVCPRHIF